MSTMICALEEAPEDAAVVGGKAAGLSRLARADAHVPPGFVIMADALTTYLGTNGIRLAIEAAASEREAAEILRAAAWPEALRSEIAGAVDALAETSAGAPVAVRSSALAEDGVRASFAGQHRTLLNVRGREAVLDAVLQCWASLYSAEAQQYRRAQAAEHDRTGMAVVVQALVPAEASGVAFTLDPVSGDRDLVVIEAAWGLGEGVVGGVVSPDHLAVRTSDGAVVRREVAEKRVQVSAVASGGTTTEELPADLAGKPALSDEQAVALARLAVTIEERAGSPQDIEWALAGGRFFILQSRPVTAAASEDGWVSEFDTDADPNTVWTAGNVQEVLPDQLSPFNCSVTAKMIEEFGAKGIERMGVKLKKPIVFSAVFYGRPFLNVTLSVEVADQIPFASVEGVLEQFYDMPRELLPAPTPFSLAKLWRYANTLPRMLWYSLRYAAEVRRAERIVDQFERELDGRAPSDLDDEALLQRFVQGLRPATDVAITHVSGAGLTSTRFDILRSITRSWLHDEDGSLHARLCTGLAGIESAQPACELWDLSRLVLASEQLREAFQPPDGAETERRLATLRGLDVSSFRRRLDEFLRRHGHRSVMEAEVAAKSWEEDLPTVFAMIRNYLHADPALSPQRIEERQRREREEATQACLARLSWWRRPIFRRLLTVGQEAIASREHTKSLLVRGTQRGRRLTRELARRLVARGFLDDVFDLYYLTLDDVSAVVHDALDREGAYALIDRRKAEAARNEQVVLPEYVRGRPAPLRPEDRPLPDGHLLRGIAVSPGRVTGSARVILDPRRDATIEPGEILVAPVTDAGWTPLFVAAAAVVVDIGGTLSHGSTVAREYGLPAVVNVKHATRMIRTGQTVTVDGTLGVVVLGSDGDIQPPASSG